MPNIEQVFDMRVLVLNHLADRYVSVCDDRADRQETFQEIQRPPETLLLHMVAAVDLVTLE